MDSSYCCRTGTQHTRAAIPILTSDLIESTVHVIFLLSPGIQLVRKGSELSPVHITEEQWYINLVLFQKMPRHPVEGFLGYTLRLYWKFLTTTLKKNFNDLPWYAKIF